MSRSYNQRHPRSHNGGSPRAILGKNEDGNLIERKRKIKPYGRKNFIGFGEEEYERKFGEYCAPQTAKCTERRKNKISIYDSFNSED